MAWKLQNDILRKLMRLKDYGEEDARFWRSQNKHGVARDLIIATVN